MATPPFALHYKSAPLICPFLFRRKIVFLFPLGPHILYSAANPEIFLKIHGFFLYIVGKV